MKGQRKKMKNILKRSTIATFAIMMVIAAGCTSANESAQLAPKVAVTTQNNETDDQPHMAAQSDTETTLTEAEIEGLKFMREEEKLAGDVYRYLYAVWGSPVFSNIAESEDMHTQSVLALLNAYGIEDPAMTEAGQFSNPDLQALYDQLIAQGSQSLQDAYLVGGAIEEIDILDLQARIAETERADIKLVYENLIAGSENHLRAFVRVYENQVRQTYAAQHMLQAQYEAIMADENGFGQGAGQGFGQGNGAGKP
jgi:hypothetical protein